MLSQFQVNLYDLYIHTHTHTHTFVCGSQSNNPKLTNFERGETTAQILGSIIKITPSITMMCTFFMTTIRELRMHE